MGIKEEIYLLDVLTFSRGLDGLKEVLEDERVDKVVWDGRALGSELWHGNGISVRGVVDLQLLQVRQRLEKEGVRSMTGGALKVESLESASGVLDEEGGTRNEPGVDIKSMRLSSSTYL